jgi:outer membrane protein
MKRVVYRVVVVLLAAVSAAAAQTPPAQPAAPVPAPAPQSTGRPVVDLRIEEAVQRAQEKNLDIAVERLNPQTFDLSIASLRSIYSPTLTSTVGKNDQYQLPRNTLTGGTRVQNNVLTYNGGVSQSLPWGGGNFAVNFNNFKTITNSANANFNPEYRSTFTANFTQPLLRGFLIDQTRQQILTTQISRDVAEVQLRATVANTLANVRNAYWDLVYALRAVQVAQRSFDLASRLVDDNRTRVEIGTMAPIDIVQAEAEAATRRQTLVAAQAARRTAELALKRLIVSGTNDPLWAAELNPVDEPSFASAPIDVDAATRRALAERTDVEQARRTIESNQVTLRYLHNQMLPAVDLVASYGLQGIGGVQALRENPNRADSPIIGYTTGNYFDALSLLRARDYPTWNLQLNISYPIGKSAAEAQYARSQVQLNQARVQVEALQLQVATEVANAALTLQSNGERVQAARVARELAEKRLEAENSKFEVGMSTNYFVVQAQRDLADAQNSELRAIADYNKSLVEFERVQRTSASRSGVTQVSSGGTGGTGGTSGTTRTTTGTGGGGGQ